MHRPGLECLSPEEKKLISLSKFDKVVTGEQSTPISAQKSSSDAKRDACGNNFVKEATPSALTTAASELRVSSNDFDRCSVPDRMMAISNSLSDVIKLMQKLQGYAMTNKYYEAYKVGLDTLVLLLEVDRFLHESVRYAVFSIFCDIYL